MPGEASAGALVIFSFAPSDPIPVFEMYSFHPPFIIVIHDFCGLEGEPRFYQRPNQFTSLVTEAREMADLQNAAWAAWGVSRKYRWHTTVETLDDAMRIAFQAYGEIERVRYLDCT